MTRCKRDPVLCHEKKNSSVESSLYGKVVKNFFSPKESHFFCSTYEPEWTGAIGRKGDVFYVEAGEARPDRQLSTVATSHENSSHNENDTNRKSEKKSKKSIKKSVKTLITTNKKDSKVEVKQEQRNNLRNGVQQNGHSPSVTFNDRPTGMIKDVRLFVDPSRNNYGRRASLCESLFGIVPGNFNSKPENHNASIDNRIMVQALLPGNEAIKSGDIKIGNCNSFF